MSKNFNKKSVFPLDWPSAIPRSKTPERSRFKTTLAKSLKNVENSLELLAKDSNKKVRDIVISSNYSLNNTNPEDGGVCVYFFWDGIQMCYPIDRYNRIQDNLQAIYHIIEADRTKLRHGSFELIMAEKRGDTLMLDSGESKPWYVVLGVNKTDSYTVVSEQYKKLVKLHHPDRPSGNNETFIAINKAWKEYIDNSKPTTSNE